MSTFNYSDTHSVLWMHSRVIDPILMVEGHPGHAAAVTQLVPSLVTDRRVQILWVIKKDVLL